LLLLLVALLADEFADELSDELLPNERRSNELTLELPGIIHEMKIL